ncbi:hypothetical protein HDE_08009 [Halotydeus destructor]|nr:hypothetical protein HDE_08009 [Halotydeus destructor]
MMAVNGTDNSEKLVEPEGAMNVEQVLEEHNAVPTETGEQLLQMFTDAVREKIKDDENAMTLMSSGLRELIYKVQALDTNELPYMESDGFKILIREVTADLKESSLDEGSAKMIYNDFIMEIKNDLERKKSKQKFKETLQTLGPAERAREKRQAIRNKMLIKQLHKQMLITQKKKDKLQLREIEDLDSDKTYVKVERLEKRIVNLYKKVKELEGTKFKTGRLLEKKFKFNSSSADINKAVSKEVTKLLRQRTRSGIFRYTAPDYNDIVSVVSATESGSKLPKIRLDELCKSIFREVIQEIKRRRVMEDQDLVVAKEKDEDFKSPIVTEDAELEAKLKVNDELKKSEKDVLAEFIKKQEEGGVPKDDDGEETDCESQESDMDDSDESVSDSDVEDVEKSLEIDAEDQEKISSPEKPIVNVLDPSLIKRKEAPVVAPDVPSDELMPSCSTDAPREEMIVEEKELPAEPIAVRAVPQVDVIDLISSDEEE